MGTLFFGGSFNPIHHGHLICARTVAEAKGFSRIVLVPTANPPHKPTDPTLAPAEHRLAMCKRAVIGSSLFSVDDLELHRSGPSYTIDTVRALRQRGVGHIPWLIGADMLAILPKWHQAESLMKEAELLVMARPGWTFDWASLPSVFRNLRNSVVQTPLIDISATDIRHRIATGKSIDYLTPASVGQYIAQHHLYR